MQTPPPTSAAVDLLSWVLVGVVAVIGALSAAVVALWRRGEAEREKEREAARQQYATLAGALDGIKAQLLPAPKTQEIPAANEDKADSGRTKTIAQQVAEAVLAKQGDQKTLADAIGEIREVKDAVLALAQRREDERAYLTERNADLIADNARTQAELARSLDRSGALEQRLGRAVEVLEAHCAARKVAR